MKIGSFCTGYGGLDLAAEAYFGATTAWTSDIDKGACKIIEARFPDAPNIGDLTKLGWSEVPPVDIITAGYPCQPFSQAGKREGLNDPRHIWPFILQAIGSLRPRYVILENVRGHLSLGSKEVVQGLAGIGYDTEWSIVRASDVGACHQRARLFIVAGTSDTDGRRLEVGQEQHGEQVEDPADGHPCGRHADGLRLEDPADTSDLGRERAREARGRGTGPTDSDRQGAAPADASGGGGPGVSGELDEGRPLVGAVAGPGRGAGAGDLAEGVHELGRGERMAWGGYEPAIRRHEAVLGRPAPSPVGEKGRLNPPFVEWMMMLSEGWVTDVLPAKTNALKALGNGVVPAQAYHAIKGLMER